MNNQKELKKELCEAELDKVTGGFKEDPNDKPYNYFPCKYCNKYNVMEHYTGGGRYPYEYYCTSCGRRWNEW